MKVLSSIQGMASIRCPIEEWSADVVAPWQDISNAVQARYSFTAVSPPGSQPMSFHNGAFQLGETRHGIMSLQTFPNGDIVTAKDTDVADFFLDDFVNFLDDTFKYRLTGAARRYVSVVVVEFDQSFEEAVAFFASMQGIVDPAPVPKMQLRRISFGLQEPEPTMMGQPVVVAPLDVFERTEFLIERRSGQPFDTNRFFCTAPLTTPNHIEALRDVEKAVGRRKK